MAYVVTGNRVLVNIEKAETKTASGLIIPDNNKLPTYATVIAIGTDVNGSYAQGDRVILSSRYAGSVVPTPDNSDGDWRVINDTDILVTII